MITVYKKLVQGLIYSPPDCDKYLALDAKPQGSVALALTLAPTACGSAMRGFTAPVRERERAAMLSGMTRASDHQLRSDASHLVLLFALAG